ncbi:3-hydroxyisobutyryl-CoA hydrolase-like protein 2, mitochondrial [Vitis riparia]|uniref:3-hydroxyisobutyryl-CoA hydrolase-like protein 2, mitochondrial n=1 Tax=Vitis riparia TaxID=96939 RepID=UPI00155AC6CB|nr:3-hydroxyisobutyryl-CoA hydrolase-like protein 2, mitochondrial [Vitis riparia]
MEKRKREGKRAEKTQGLKVLWRSRRSGIHCPPFFTHHKAISHIPNLVAVNDFDSEVLVEGEGCSRTAILNRPHALNALNASMGAKLQNPYKSWEENPDIGFVVMKGSGRAFCAGGDIVGLYKLINEEKIQCTLRSRIEAQMCYLLSPLWKCSLLVHETCSPNS